MLAGVYTTSSQYLRKNHLNEVSGVATNTRGPILLSNIHIHIFRFFLQVLLQVQVSPRCAFIKLNICACSSMEHGGRLYGSS